MTGSSAWVIFLCCLVVLCHGHPCRERVAEQQAVLWLLGWSDFCAFDLEESRLDRWEWGRRYTEWVTRQPAVSKHRWVSERAEVAGGRRRKCGRPCEVEALQVCQQPLSPLERYPQCFSGPSQLSALLLVGRNFRYHLLDKGSPPLQKVEGLTGWCFGVNHLALVFSRVLMNARKSRELWLCLGVSKHWQLAQPQRPSLRGLCSHETPLFQWAISIRQCLPREMADWMAAFHPSAQQGTVKPREVRLLRNFPFASHSWNKVLSMALQGQSQWLCFLFCFSVLLLFDFWKVPRTEPCNPWR